MKVLIIGDDSSYTQIALLEMICAKMGISFEVIQEKKSQNKDISEIIQELLVLKPPSIPIPLEIPVFLEGQTEEKKKIFFDERLKLISFVGQPKTVRIRSPCTMGIYFLDERNSFCLNV